MAIYCYTPEPELVNTFIDLFITNGYVHVAFGVASVITCVLTELGYTVKVDPMTYTQVMHDYAPDRNFDIIRLKAS